MEDELILKEISNILRRVNADGKEKILASARNVIDQCFCHDALVVDGELREGSRKEFEGLKQQGAMSIRASDFEKSVTMLNIIAGKMDFEKKFRIILEYNPELLSATVKYFWD